MRGPQIATTCFSELTAHPMTCGVATQHHPPTNRASLSLALLSVVLILLRFSWLRRRRSTESCWRGSQRCPISSVRGSCYCSVQHQEPVTFSELSIPNTVSSLPSAGIRQCLEILVHTPITQSVWEMASLPFGIGGLSLRHAERLRSTACWSSWAGTLPMIRQRHLQVADHILVSLSQGRGGFHSETAGESRNRLMNARVDAPEWGGVDKGQRQSCHPDDEFPRFSRMGWQSFASTKMEEIFLGTHVSPRLNPTDRALVRSQRGPMASIPFHTPPPHPVSILSVPRCFFCVAFGASSH